MKKTNRIVSLVLTLCMLVSLVAVLPLSVSAADTPTFNHEKYEIKNVTFVAGGSLIFGSAEDMLQWSDVDVAGYSISVYAEGGSESIHLVYTEANYMAAANVLPYSGDFYVTVTPVNDNSLSLAFSTASEVFTYTDNTPPTAVWQTEDTVRSSDAEATVRFNNKDRLSACTYYYAVVESGEAAPTIDTSGTGAAAVWGFDNYINLTNLTAGAKDIYLVLKDQDGNASEPIMTTIPAYEAAPTYSLRIFTTVLNAGTGTDEGGSISGAGNYKAGETVTLTATPNSGYCAISWASNNNVILPTGSQNTMTVTFIMPAADVEITGSFRLHKLGVFYEDLGDGTHDDYCFYCKEKEGNPTAHRDLTDYTGEGAPDGYCDDCGADMHTHSYSSEWSKDEDGHWHECECGDKKDFAEHTSSGAATEEKAEVCTVCDYEIAPKVDHIHAFSTLKSNEVEHWMECACGAKSDVAAHTSSGAATEEKAEVCTVCDYEISPKLPPSHVHDFSILKSDANCHWYECECYDISLPSDHSGGTATCEERAECDTCGTPYGKLAEHSYSSAWVTNSAAHWHVCSACDARGDWGEHDPIYYDTFGGEMLTVYCAACRYDLTPEKTMYTLTLQYSFLTNFTGDAPSTWAPEEIALDIGNKTITVEAGTVVDLSYYYPSPLTTKGSGGERYHFAGFAENSNNTGEIVHTVTVNGNMKLYARWVQNKMITIDLHNGKGYLPYMQTREERLVSLDQMNQRHRPTRAGYEFLGWSLEDDDTADRGGKRLAGDCTLYAVWSLVGFYDVGSVDVLPALPVVVGGEGDVVDVSDPLTEKIIHNGTDLNIGFKSGTGAVITTDGLIAIRELMEADDTGFRISVNNADAGALPAELTGEEPFEDDEILFDSKTLISGATIFTEQELLAWGVISADDEEITWAELKYLYQHMSTEKMKSLRRYIEDFPYNIDPDLSAWLDEMIERDKVELPMRRVELTSYLTLTREQATKLGEMGLSSSAHPTIGQLRELGLTEEQMRLLYTKVSNGYRDSTDPHEKEKYDAMAKWLLDAIAPNEQEDEDSSTYVNVGGERALLIAALEVDVKAVRASGTTRNIEILADRSNAVAWSTNIGSAALEEMLAMLGAATTEDVVSNIKAYKVLDNGTLEARASKGTVNADGTLTLSAMSDGNSTCF